MSETPVILVGGTVMSGTVVRWYRSVADAEIHRPVLEAARRGVNLGPTEYLTDIPDEWIAAARDAHQQLVADRHADLSHLATHRHGRGLLNGPLEPVDRGEGSG
jgi:hypothetical protein